MLEEQTGSSECSKYSCFLSALREAPMVPSFPSQEEGLVFIICIWAGEHQDL